MVIKIKLYGDLREKVSLPKIDPGVSSNLDMEINELKTVLDVLNKLDIKIDEISHVFLNNRYSGIKKEVKNGDRIGIFPKKMGIMFVEVMNE